MRAARVLHDAVAEVAPIDGVAGPYPPPSTQYSFTVFPAVDGSLWAVHFKSGATTAQKRDAQNAVAAFDPAGPAATAQETYTAAINAGLTLTWTVSTALNGTYAIDEAMTSKINVEYQQLRIDNTFSSGGTSKPWPDLYGKRHTFSADQFKQFASAINRYVSILGDRLSDSLAGTTVTWPPGNGTITG